MNVWCGKFNLFCYICGKFTAMANRRKLTDEIDTLYKQYFNLPVIKDKPWVPSVCCSTCSTGLKRWANGHAKCMPFGIPMIWTDPGNHNADGCYVCVNIANGLNRMRPRNGVYKSVQSAQTPSPHSESVPIPKKPSPTQENIPPTSVSEPGTSHSIHQPSNITSPCKHIEFSQNRLDIMARQLKLSQARQIVLTQQLKAMNILSPGVKIYDAHGRQREFLKLFDQNEENTFSFCNDIGGLMLALGHLYKPEEWRLFIGSSKNSLKAVLLYFDNTKKPVPIAISTNTDKNYESMKKIIESIKYDQHSWKICADLKVISLLCGLHLGYTKNLCYMCYWDKRHVWQYAKRDWPLRQNTRVVPLVPSENILLLPSFIKLGIVKNYIKELVARNNQQAFERLEANFPRLRKSKIKEGEYFSFNLQQIFFNTSFKILILYSKYFI